MQTVVSSSSTLTNSSPTGEFLRQSGWCHAAAGRTLKYCPSILIDFLYPASKALKWTSIMTIIGTIVHISYNL